MGRTLTSEQHYRYWILWRCAGVRFLDYQKVKKAERDRATELFGSDKEPTDLAQTIMGIKSSTTFDVSSTSNGSTGGLSSRMSRIKLTDKEKKRLQDMIRNATSLDEITRLETMLKEGRMPAGVHAADEMEE
jgi:U2 small nuclear ribonucleoprotein A'